MAFALLATILGLALIEGGARLAESFAGAGQVLGRSNLAFQQLPDEPLLTEVEGPSGRRLVATGDWLDRVGWSVAVPKPADELRVVLMGGSAAAGWNSPTGATLARTLERILDDATPGRRVRVLNLARTGYASPQLSWIAGQVLGPLQPDLLVTLMGNNEKHDLVVAANLVEGGLYPLVLTQKLSRHLALARLLRAARPLEPGAQPEFFDPYMIDDQERITAAAASRLGDNLAEMSAVAEQAGAQMLLLTVPINDRLHGSWGEWAFFGEQADVDAYRRAHWAEYYEDPYGLAMRAMRERVASHPAETSARLVLAHLLHRAGMTEAADVARTVLDDLGRRDEPDEVEQRMLGWATAISRGPDASAELIAPWVEGARSRGDAGNNACLDAELLYWSGHWEASSERYFACAGNARYLRGGPAVNAAIVAAASALGRPSFDLAEALRDQSPHGLSGYRYFWDYCHYNPRGNWVVAHLLAEPVAAALGLTLAVPDPIEAEVLWSTERAGRVADLLDPHSWAGVDADALLLTAEYEPNDPRWKGRPDKNHPGRGALFSAHRDAGRVVHEAPELLWRAWEAYSRLSDSPDPSVAGGAAAGLARLEIIARNEGLRWPPPADVSP